MPESSCPKYIAPGSKEARELKTRCACKHLKVAHMCGTSKCEVMGCKCGQFTVAGPDPKYISTDSRDQETTRADKGKPIDSSMLDRALMEATILDLEDRRRRAIQATQACLSAARAGAPRTASRYAERALKALGALGAS
jgi:hypothetical protein